MVSLPLDKGGVGNFEHILEGRVDLQGGVAPKGTSTRKGGGG